MRVPIIIGNWKMNKTIEEVYSFVDIVKKAGNTSGIECGICAPYVFLQALGEVLKGTSIRIGAQNVHWEESGAYTGEISAKMLASCGVRYVIIGHSERRAYFSETNEMVNKKLQAVFNNHLQPIVCVGETLDERGAGKTAEAVTVQITEALRGVSLERVRELVIAYEPVWAIGTGRSSTATDAQEVIGLIRQTIAALYDPSVADRVRIQYGGSVTAENISSFMSQTDIDGALVGGASLDPISFLHMLDGVR